MSGFKDRLRNAVAQATGLNDNNTLAHMPSQITITGPVTILLCKNQALHQHIHDPEQKTEALNSSAEMA